MQKKFLFFTLVLFLVVLFITFSQYSHAQTIPPQIIKKLRAIQQRPFRSLCDFKNIGIARCHAKVVTKDDLVTPLAAATPSATSMGPLQLHIAYQLPCTPGGAVSGSCNTPTSFGPETIAIIIANHYPTIENDLSVYSSVFGIPPCTKSSGCLQVVDQNGGNNLPGVVDSGWALEEAMDVQSAHAICQTCKILVVEASSSTFTNLGIAVATAANMGAQAISNSYGAGEWSNESFYDSYYDHPGIAITASAGDNSYGVSYPASSQHVVAVGGTTLQLFSDNTYSSESVWNDPARLMGTGSGCSAYEVAQSFQMNVSNWLSTGCGNKHGTADVSAVGDPNTGFAVYTTTPYNGSTGWFQMGGTSLSSPIIAASFAMAHNIPGNAHAASVLYQNAGAANFHDVTQGSNGSCNTSMCKALIGYDGPTGLGTPYGLGGFRSQAVATPTPTLTPTPTNIPSVTPTPTAIPSLTPTPGDTKAPSITITNPLNGTTIKNGNTITIRATASDNIKVTKVEFYVNNALIATDTSSPYNTSWRVPNGKGIVYTISAKAYDAALNSSTSSVTITSK